MADRIPGVTIDVGELIAVRAKLDGLAHAKTRHRASERSGAREIRLRGRGMEYEESRSYVFGDDVRTMDWRVMARTGEPHTKVFAEEKERSCLIAVDLSPTMFFGTRFAFKSWAAAQLAAHLGWLASLGGERIGGLVAASTHHAEIRPGKTRSGLFGLFHHLALADARRTGLAAGSGRLGLLLGELKRVARPGADIVLVSDFLDLDRRALQYLSTLTRHNQLYCYRVNDDSELDEWPRGRYPVMSDRGLDYLDLDDSRHRDSLRAQQRRLRENVESMCSRFNLPMLQVSCNRDITLQLRQAQEKPA